MPPSNPAVLCNVGKNVLFRWGKGWSSGYAQSAERSQNEYEYLKQQQTLGIPEGQKNLPRLFA